MKLFFSTELAPCPYLAARLERRLVTLLDGPDPDALHERLMQAGFRRSQGLAYRPACPGCAACVPVRIPVDRFRLTRAWRRIWRRNADLVAAERRPAATPEQFALFQRYLASRHGDSGMTTMTWADFRAMIDDGPVDSRLVEWRCPDRSLIAASLTDCVRAACPGSTSSSIPSASRRSLGSLTILWHVERARELGPALRLSRLLDRGQPKMAYKARFQPLEQLTTAGWQPLQPAEVGNESPAFPRSGGLTRGART